MWIILPKTSEWRTKRKITWFYGIDPIELKDGTFALPERVIKGIEKFDIKFRKIADKEIDKELKKLSKKDKVIFKDATIQQDKPGEIRSLPR